MKTLENFYFRSQISAICCVFLLYKWQKIIHLCRLWSSIGHNPMYRGHPRIIAHVDSCLSRLSSIWVDATSRNWNAQGGNLVVLARNSFEISIFHLYFSLSNLTGARFPIHPSLLKVTLQLAACWCRINCSNFLKSKSTPSLWIELKKKHLLWIPFQEWKIGHFIIVLESLFTANATVCCMCSCGRVIVPFVWEWTCLANQC